jgi:2-furoate---CoA ligase
MFDLGRSFLATVERRPDAVAICDGDTRRSYGEWFTDIQSLARALGEMGIAKGDRLVVAMQNRWQMASLHWACQFAGIIVTPVNWRSTASEIDYFINDSGAEAIAYDDVVAEVIPGSEQAGSLLRIALTAEENDGAIAFDSLLGRAGETIMRAAVGDISLMLYTSGTSSQPKGVPRSHAAERAAALAHIAQNQYGHDERTLGVMPLYHTMGVRSLLAMTLIDGRFVCMPTFDPAATLTAIEGEAITNLYLVPTLYHILIEHPAFAAERVASVTKIGFAGAPMSAGLMARVGEQFQPELFVNHYGSSEVYTFTIDQSAARKPGSSGRPALNQRIRVVAIEAESPNETVSAGEEGEIVADMTGDEAFAGYWRRPDADTESISGGWFFTGDTGYFDADGDLFVTGRADDLINSGGENIGPVEIESVLSTQPQVEEVAVAGTPDPRWGEIVTAFVKQREQVTEDALDQHCLDSGLARFKRPRRYVFVDEIPKSAVGKILRRRLRSENPAGNA